MVGVDVFDNTMKLLIAHKLTVLSLYRNANQHITIEESVCLDGIKRRSTIIVNGRENHFSMPNA